MLHEPGVPSKQLRSRAKAVKKLGSIFVQVNRPRSRPVTNIMEEFSEVLQVSPSAAALFSRNRLTQCVSSSGVRMCDALSSFLYVTGWSGS